MTRNYNILVNNITASKGYSKGLKQKQISIKYITSCIGHPLQKSGVEKNFKHTKVIC